MKGICLILLVLLVSGCVRLPEEPPQEMFLSTATISDGLVEQYVYQSRRAETVFKRGPEKRRNLLLVVADSFIQNELRSKAEQYLGYTAPDDLDLEELSWWHYAPLLEDIYNEVYLIKRTGAQYAIIQEAVERLERKEVSYDIIFLTHGLPNHISPGQDYFLSWYEIARWKGKLHHLNLVFMQGCFGRTLEQDWAEAGAQMVISYDGFNQNFFYLSSFLRWYRWMPDDVPTAYAKANTYLASNIESSLLYRTIIQKVLESDVNAYLANSELPVLFETGQSL
ncbi:MAG: hypothetical protein OXC68_10455 [Aestuariivita sp.]|nr:hypothetical protein [Aestuariivita sp.]